MTEATPSFSTWRKVAMAIWCPRRDQMIWATSDIEASRLLQYIDRGRHTTGQHVTSKPSPCGRVRPPARPLGRDSVKR